MSTHEKFCTQVGNLCVGAFALVYGVSSSGVAVATGSVGLAALGASYFLRSNKRIISEAQARALRQLCEIPEYSSVDFGRISALLDEYPPSFTRDDLVAASISSENYDLPVELARVLQAKVLSEHEDEPTRRIVRLALEAGLRACSKSDEFMAEVNATQNLFLVQRVADMSTTVHRIEKLISRPAAVPVANDIRFASFDIKDSDWMVNVDTKHATALFDNLSCHIDMRVLGPKEVESGESYTFSDTMVNRKDVSIFLHEHSVTYVNALCFGVRKGNRFVWSDEIKESGYSVGPRESKKYITTPYPHRIKALPTDNEWDCAIIYIVSYDYENNIKDTTNHIKHMSCIKYKIV